MFHDHWGIIHRRLNSAGKRTVKIPYFWRPTESGANTEDLIFANKGVSQKGSRRRAASGPHHVVARHPPGRRHQVVWRPWPTNRPPPSPKQTIQGKSQKEEKKAERRERERDRERSRAIPLDKPIGRTSQKGARVESLGQFRRKTPEFLHRISCRPWSSILLGKSLLKI